MKKKLKCGKNGKKWEKKWKPKFLERKVITIAGSGRVRQGPAGSGRHWFRHLHNLSELLVIKLNFKKADFVGRNIFFHNVISDMIRV